MDCARILVVDGRAEKRSAVVRLLKHGGYSVATAERAQDAMEQLEAFEPDLVLTDVRMADMTAVAFISRLRELASPALVVVVSSERDVESAVEVMTAGAADYLAEPVADAALLDAVRGALERRNLESAKRHAGLLPWRSRPGALVGASVQSQEVLRAVAQVAPSEATVLLVGESGTGKDLVATTIHARSRHATGAFVKVHCGAFDDDYRERELPSDPNATDSLVWLFDRFEQALGGTLYLDAVDELSPSAQSRLARALQEHEIRREGAGRRIGTDMRLVAASRRELAELVELSEFRQDLFYRLSVVTLRLQPLRHRLADVPSLAAHFVVQFARQLDKPVRGISPAALDVLSAHTWPGNVRELENTIERAVVLAGGERIEPRHLPAELSLASPRTGAPPIPGASLAEIERYAILKTLEAQEGKVALAAKVLGISPRKVQYKLRQYVGNTSAE